MKKILKMLVLGLLSAALLCCALPSAFAAEQKDAQIYTIGLDAMGGTSSVVAVTTNLNGKLSALPAQPTLDGYTFDGWYTETVGGTKVTTSTVFTGDTTVYAHWTVKSTAASSSTSTSKPAQPEQTEQDDGMTLSISAFSVIFKNCSHLGDSSFCFHPFFQSSAAALHLLENIFYDFCRKMHKTALFVTLLLQFL